MPEYAFAIDRYVPEREAAAPNEPVPHLHVQEYAAPKEIEQESVRRRRREVLSSLPGVFGVSPEHIHLRVRQRQSGAAQYQPQRHADGRAEAAAAAAAPFVIREAGLRFWVNLDDYLDTGLFLDHRLTRARLRQRAAGLRFLNLFCYTASATVYAAAGDARDSLSLDMSNAYLDWASREFRTQRPRSGPSPARAGRLPRMAARRRCGTLRSHFSRSTHVFEFQAHAGRARRAARPCRVDRALHAAAGARRATGVFL